MAKYVHRTCVECGKRDIQPNMVQKKVKVKTGRSDTGLSFGIVAGSFLGNKRSLNKLNQRIFANNRRNYTRFKNIWLCKFCAETYKEDQESFYGIAGFGVVLIILFIFMI
jgi:hypothetical protein